MSVLKDLLSIHQPAAKPVVAEKYDESADFDAEYEKLQAHLDDARDIVISEDWTSHLKATDSNFDTSAVELNRRAKVKIEEAIHAIQDLYSHIVEGAQ